MMHRFSFAKCRTTSHTSYVNQAIYCLVGRSSIKDLRNLNFFLGVEVFRVADGITLSQSNYISEILSEENMKDYNYAKTPMSSNEVVKQNDGAEPTDATCYKRVLGKLPYMSFTHPDISFSVYKLSQFMHSTSEVHWKAYKRVLKYLQGTIQFGLRIQRDNDFKLHMKQRTISRSSTEAEYRAVASILGETNWVTNLLNELHVSLPQASTIYCDNVGAPYQCENPISSRILSPKHYQSQPLTDTYSS
uniref:Uncharacterized mitochondrial protein AtMg00810-like n=1 Tax=Nicotiana tabacum TaxID=4097 RepID=A0A1S4BFQ6_TOBAC|nr:PREDICTED: uncharacterized mitochondrial protein AtMg00810-like [Nicotiana tabacum]